MTSEQQTALMHQYGLRDTGGVDLRKFVVNPRSFGQTVENLFYVSFLIRDGKVAIEFDEFDLPTLSTIDPHILVVLYITDTKAGPVDAESEQPATDRRKGGPSKHQAIFSMDMATWKDIIDTFEISEPLIPHRKEQTHQGPGARGWYS